MRAESTKDFEILSRMKARAAQEIDKEYGVDNREVICFVREIGQSFVPFLPQGKQDIFSKKMEVIIRQALELTVNFLKSRALFFIKGFPDNPIDADICLDEWAKRPGYGKIVEQEGLQPTIDFIVTPCLIKRGSADGHKFDMKTVLCKAVVVFQEAMPTPAETNIVQESDASSLKTEGPVEVDEYVDASIN